MAARKKVAKKGVAGLPATIQQRILAKQERFGNREAQNTGKQITFKSKQFKFDGDKIGDTMDVVLLDYVFVNQYFSTDYDPDNITPADCFALADEEMELKPLAEVLHRQVDTDEDMCTDCWANQWGSADRGDGKACQNRRRVAVISAELFNEKDWAETLDADNVGYISLGGTTLKAWRTYTNKVGKKLGLAPFQVVTQLGFDDEEDFDKLTFTTLSVIEESEQLEKLLDVTDEIQDELHAAPDFSQVHEDEPKKPQRKKPAAKKKTAAKKRPPPKRSTAKKTAGRKSKFS